jgi:transcriptional regulator with XRE-family HTH domain
VADHARFFRVLGRRIREFRVKNGYSQEDMISFGFSARHWQQIEAGRPVTVKTLLRICDTFDVTPERLLRALYRPE